MNSLTQSCHSAPASRFVLWLGMGYQQGTSQALLTAAVQEALQAGGLAWDGVAGVATLDRKAQDAALLAFCGDRHLPLRCFSATALQTVAVPHPSVAVAAQVATPSVAEAAALLACQLANPTGQPHLRVPKRIFRLPEQPGVVTVAIAQVVSPRLRHL